jgi:glycosyltransferase 2 family protein
MKKLKSLFWPLIGLAAVIWSIRLLYFKLKAEAAGNKLTSSALEQGSLWDNLKVISIEIGHKLAAIPTQGYVLAACCTLIAYGALAWYDRIALIHLRKEKTISWFYVATCSFVTYALSHNIGGSVFSGGLVRFRAYTAKGLNAVEVAVLVAITSFTFSFGTILCGGLVLLLEPNIVRPLLELSQMNISELWIKLIGVAMLAFCTIYIMGSLFKLKPLNVKGHILEYPDLPVVTRQLFAAPIELLGAAGIIYFVLPELGNPGFFVVLGAFLLSFSAGLIFQVPGGIGVMETVFIAVMPSIAPISVFAALLVWRLFYLIIPLILSIPVVLLFERSQFLKGRVLTK